MNDFNDEPPIPSKRKLREIEDNQSEEEEDYLSNELLKKMERKQQEKREELTYSDKRRLARRESERKQQEDRLYAKSQEEKLRKAALESSLPEENKGFQLLKKMGYVPGSSLGSTNQGIIEPIKVHAKKGRYGLGAEEMIKERITDLQSQNDYDGKMDEEVFELRQKEFKEKTSDLLVHRRMAKELSDSIAACETLDKKKNLSFKFGFLLEEDSANGEQRLAAERDEKEVLKGKLDLITKYLRTKHNYCIWCGIEYDNEQDLSSNCPGPSFEAH